MRFAQYLLLCALVGAAQWGSARCAVAYNIGGGRWTQPGGLGNPVTLTYSYQNMFDNALLMPNGQPLPKLLIRDSIEEALSLWASVAPLYFVEVEDDGLNAATSTKSGIIRFRHRYINGPDPPPPANPVAKAQAYYPSTTALAGDVEYDHGDRWQEVGTTPQPDILGATVHELGHSLGLDHSALEAANMYWIFNRSAGLGTAFLHQDDINGIQAIYGAGAGSVTPLAGSWPDRAIPPASAGLSESQFTNVPSNRWVETPLGSELGFTGQNGTLFSRIADFPTGFGDLFTVSVGDTVVGNFAPGQSVSFQSFPGGGVSEFEISSMGLPESQQNTSLLSASLLSESPLAFPLKLAFTTPTGSFAVSAVPEPAAYLLLFLALLGLGHVRRRR